MKAIFAAVPIAMWMAFGIAAHAQTYAAIAFSASDSKTGKSYWCPNQAYAEAVAVQDCQQHGGASCRAVYWGVNEVVITLVVGYSNTGAKLGFGRRDVDQGNYPPAETLAWADAANDCVANGGIPNTCNSANNIAETVSPSGHVRIPTGGSYCN
jgi:hypothetical protein